MWNELKIMSRSEKDCICKLCVSRWPHFTTVLHYRSSKSIYMGSTVLRQWSGDRLKNALHCDTDVVCWVFTSNSTCVPVMMNYAMLPKACFLQSRFWRTFEAFTFGDFGWLINENLMVLEFCVLWGDMNFADCILDSQTAV